MGHTTDFYGEFELDRPLTDEHAAYLRQFNSTRRMKRTAAIAELLPDPIREAAGLPLGVEGAYFVGGAGLAGQDHDSSVVDHNQPPRRQPGLWCQWTPSDDGARIMWDGGEKFYEYIAWLDYIVQRFLAPWGYVLNGNVTWQGEDPEDRGRILVRNNNVGYQDVLEAYGDVKWVDNDS